jgi:TalC/MipB family fructose-6-phosphate aldolase
MEIWLDTSSVQAVQMAQRLGILHGVTTNPSIAAHSGVALDDLLQTLLKAQSGPVTAQVVASKADEMVRQGEALAAVSSRIIVKIPALREGLQAMYILSQKKIPVMATAVFDPSQTLLAARAGAQYIVPYFSHICEADQDGINELRAMVQLLQRYHFSSKILAASLQSTEQVKECCALGVDAVTLNEKLFEEYLEDNPLTVKTMAKFDRDWKGAAARKTLPF